MSIPGPAPLVPVMDVLRECGWVPDDDRSWSEEPALKYNFGNFELTAAVFLTERFIQEVVFRIRAPTRISFGESDFELPEFVESREQALALISHFIRRERPASPPDWLEEGRRCQHLLPWRKNMEAYERRPQASVERTWMRPLGRALREAAASAQPGDCCIVHFDGATIRFDLPSRHLIVQAEGPEPWAESVSVSLQALVNLPKRWINSIVNVSIWDGCVCIGNRRFPVVSGPVSF